jgi:hypothetical protein
MGFQSLPNPLNVCLRLKPSSEHLGFALEGLGKYSAALLYELICRSPMRVHLMSLDPERVLRVQL